MSDEEYQLIMDSYGASSDSALLSSQSSSGAGEAIAMLFVILFFLVIYVVTYVIFAFLTGRIFKKAGVAPWKAWVPFLNNWKIYEIGGREGFWSLLVFVPIVNIVSLVFFYMAVHNINLKLKYGAGMTVLAIMLPAIWLIVVGLSKEEWNDSLGSPSLAKREFPIAEAAYASQATASVAPMQPPMQPQPQNNPDYSSPAPAPQNEESPAQESSGDETTPPTSQQ